MKRQTIIAIFAIFLVLALSGPLTGCARKQGTITAGDKDPLWRSYAQRGQAFENCGKIVAAPAGVQTFASSEVKAEPPRSRQPKRSRSSAKAQPKPAPKTMTAPGPFLQDEPICPPGCVPESRVNPAVVVPLSQRPSLTEGAPSAAFGATPQTPAGAPALAVPDSSPTMPPMIQSAPSVTAAPMPSGAVVPVTTPAPLPSSSPAPFIPATGGTQPATLLPPLSGPAPSVDEPVSPAQTPVPPVTSIPAPLPPSASMTPTAAPAPSFGPELFMPQQQGAQGGGGQNTSPSSSATAPVPVAAGSLGEPAAAPVSSGVQAP